MELRLSESIDRSIQMTRWRRRNRRGSLNRRRNIWRNPLALQTWSQLRRKLRQTFNVHLWKLLYCLLNLQPLPYRCLSQLICWPQIHLQLSILLNDRMVCICSDLSDRSFLSILWPIHSVAQLSQVQQQLQTDTENSSYHRVPSAAHQPIQQHFQALSQMVRMRYWWQPSDLFFLSKAKNGDEVLITLNINAIHSKASITPSQYCLFLMKDK